MKEQILNIAESSSGLSRLDDGLMLLTSITWKVELTLNGRV